jgi:predicted enzyme related to lactoylglutathione lyase
MMKALSIIISVLVGTTAIAATSASPSAPAAKILSVGSIAIESCNDAKALADWYSRFGIQTKEEAGTYYGTLDTAAGPFVFGIHSDASKKCSDNISVTYRVENLDASLAMLKSKGIIPDLPIDKGEFGQFAYFHDPEGNKVSIWQP